MGLDSRTLDPVLLITDLQWAQHRHDESYHRDIAILPVASRIKHFALHFAKYVGALVDARRGGDEVAFSRLLTDAFIISLAAANAVALRLEDVAKRYRESGSLIDLGLAIAVSKERPAGYGDELVPELALRVGQLAKACESLDHVEDYPFRPAMQEAVIAIFEIVTVEAAMRQIDLAKTSKDRLAGVERKHMFAAQIAGS